MRGLITLVFVFCAFLAGCSTPSAVHTTGAVSAPDCEKVEEHLTASGEVIPASFRCELHNARSGVASNACVYVKGYQRKDGSFVQAHYRCKNNFLPAKVQPNLSKGGPVSVRGYYRKDGTYVRPHTRSRRR